MKTKKVLFSFFLFFLLFGFCVNAKTEGEAEDFYIDSYYDISVREEIPAVLKKIGSNIYFYIDKDWWKELSDSEKNQVNDSFNKLAKEFENNIYPTLTSNFGSEWKPGIDNDDHITVLFHPMKGNSGGYFNSGNEYSRFEYTRSNEREMFYINADYITDPLAKSFLAHEFTHLITFNQKEKVNNTVEEIWLNEARAEYAPTLCGYDSDFEESNLEKRVVTFLKQPSNSLIHWANNTADYGALNVFTQYLVDHYGLEILSDSLKSDKQGIESINYALKKNGFDQDFSDIFTDWTIAVLINDCSVGEKYCFKNDNLKNLRIAPTTNFLSINSENNLSMSSATKKWAGNWYKVFGGGGTLFFEFEGDPDGDFNVLYLICDSSDVCFVDSLTLDENQKGEIIIEDFNKKYISLYIIPFVLSENKELLNFSFSWKAETKLDGQQKEQNQDPELVKNLLTQISKLEVEIARIQTQIDMILAGESRGCDKITGNLRFGIMNNFQVRCLQTFLKNQGMDIYPEGLITGNFFSLTKKAVVRFQEKYAKEILVPFNLDNGTGYVGLKTLAKINELIRP